MLVDQTITKATNASQTILGFDFGLRRIGIAVGQTLTSTATPLQTLRCHDGNPDWPMISRCISEWCPTALVVGLPLTADGSETNILRAVRAFIRQLEQRYPLPVYGIDEYLSSHEAEFRLNVPASQDRKPAATKKPRTRYAKDAIDRVAAQIILQTWLMEHATKIN